MILIDRRTAYGLSSPLLNSLKQLNRLEAEMTIFLDVVATVDIEIF